MKLVDDWKDFWKWYSTWVITFLAMLPTMWMQIPDEYKAMIPEQYMGYIGVTLAIGSVLSRLRDQS